MVSEAPLALHVETVRPEWIDYNGHMNLAYYVLVFDHATDAFLNYIGLDDSYRERSNQTTYVLEAHVTYERELKEGAPLRVTTQLLDHDAKRLHYFHAMYHREQGFLAATNELIAMNLDRSTVKGIAMGDAVTARLAELLRRHRQLPVPPQVGRVIGIRR